MCFAIGFLFFWFLKCVVSALSLGLCFRDVDRFTIPANAWRYAFTTSFRRTFPAVSFSMLKLRFRPARLLLVVVCYCSPLSRLVVRARSEYSFSPVFLSVQ